MKKVFRKFIIILLISNILISSYLICKELQQNKKQENNFKSLLKIVEQPKEKNNQQEKTTVNIKRLHDMNDEIIGWLRINGTSINYPIMQSVKHPNYYLHKDFYKKNSSFGTPYLSEQCNLNTSDNLIIYGHHIRNKKVFGALEDYKRQDFYNNYPIIEFTTLEGREKYKIFTVFKTTLEDLNSFKIYEYINFKNENEFYEFVDKVKQNSMYETNVIPLYRNKIITLCTCEYSKKNGRLIVMATKVED